MKQILILFILSFTFFPAFGQILPFDFNRVRIIYHHEHGRDTTLSHHGTITLTEDNSLVANKRSFGRYHFQAFDKESNTFVYRKDKNNVATLNENEINITFINQECIVTFHFFRKKKTKMLSSKF